MINTPHNPTGKVLTRAESEQIAAVAIEHDLLVVTDEVYEHLAYDAPHIPLATLPGMAERTLTISSGGKTFQCTGWKVGWIVGPEPLVTAVRTSKQFLTYVSGGPLQYGIVVGLRLGDDHFAALRATCPLRAGSPGGRPDCRGGSTCPPPRAGTS
ncbi:MAG: aminotransferase class I/II-fold pyridoxal phosphate-dependent enzyme [Microthrixaceae bacterium]